MTYLQYQLVKEPVKKYKAEEAYSVSCASDIYRFASDVMKLERFPEERCYVIAIDTKGKILGYQEVAQGGG